jgi:hypothetical protein
LTNYTAQVIYERLGVINETERGREVERDKERIKGKRKKKKQWV